jgi:hypothetical protein
VKSVAHAVPVSGYQKTERLVYLARMCSKARLMKEGLLHQDYHAWIGVGFDARCCRFLRIDYDFVKKAVADGLPDAEILKQCYTSGHRPNDEEVLIWNAFMSKRGWRDDDTEFLESEKKRLGFAGRPEIETLFDLYDFDEGRRI